VHDLKRELALAAAALTIAPVLIWAASEYTAAPAAGAYTAPGLAPMPPEQAREDIADLLPALLLVVYDAFGRIEEQEIYDTLALAADGPALEALYLERAGAMVGGGMTEANQIIHEIRLVRAASRRAGDVLTVDATWEVIGTVGHDEHVHIRGNTYRADLTIAPAGGAWKITGFALTTVDRGTAGTIVEVDHP